MNKPGFNAAMSCVLFIHSTILTYHAPRTIYIFKRLCAAEAGMRYEYELADLACQRLLQVAQWLAYNGNLSG